MIGSLLEWIVKNMITSTRSGIGRLRVDVSQTGFWEGREQRVSYPLSIPSATPVVLKFTSTINFILQFQNLTSDTAGILFQAWRSSQGTEGGTFNSIVGILPNNSMTTTPVYARQCTIEAGGTFTPDLGEVPSETIPVRVAGSTAQRSTVGGSSVKERGLPPGTYYLVFSNISGQGTATGVYDLVWEERP